MPIPRLLGTALIAVSWIAFPLQSPAQLTIGASISVNLAPPPLPVYQQPPVPEPGLIWMPGYWAWGPGGYFWVPGSWVAPPQPGLLWTPGYWAWSDDCGCYEWNPGYWAPQVGFYGGINYGFGYFGIGYVGAQWNGGVLAYNTAVTNVNTTIIHNTYVNRTVVVNNTITNNHVAYNGGSGGVVAHPTARELTVQNERHIPPTTTQVQHIQTASQDRNLLNSVNHGQPSDPAVSHPFSAANRPADFTPLRPEDKASARIHVKSGGQTAPPVPQYQPAPTTPRYHPMPQQYHTMPPQYRTPLPQYRGPQYRPQYPKPAAPAHASPHPHKTPGP
jgi:hypothetical protein